MKNRRSFIVGLKSTILNKNEIDFLKKYKPWGIILFTRNIKDIYQTKKLTSNIRILVLVSPIHNKKAQFTFSRS